MSRVTAAAASALVVALGATVAAAVPSGNGAVPLLGLCSAPIAATAPPSYYAIELIPTRRVPGTGASTGRAQVTFARSPFGVALSPTGAYEYSLDIRLDGLRQRPNGVFAVWAASSDLKDVALIGVPNDDMRLQGQVTWNKFLLVVSLEPAGELADRWKGPIVMRGMSRSGLMHTMAGHGPFELEPCIKYGYR